MRADLIPANALVTWDGSGEPEQLQFGQLLPEEGRVLRALARAVAADQVIVEIGSYTGKSTCCLSQGSADGHRVPVYAVDLWTTGTSRKGLHFRVRKPDEPVGNSKFHTPAVLEVFHRRMARYSAGLVRECMSESVAAAATFGGPIGLLFIDAEHTYEACRADFEAWEPKVVPDGCIALHDYALKGEQGEVKRYIDEMLDRPRCRWRIGKIVGSLLVLEPR